MLPLFSNPLNISLPSPTRLPTFCFEWADLICTFAPSHGEKHLCATKDKQVHYLLILIFQFYAVFSYKKRTMGVDPKKGKTLYVVRAVCQKQRISFDNLCEFMVDGSTVSQADVIAVFYKFRTILNMLCSQGNIVDAGPLGSFRPAFSAKSVEKEEDFKPSTHITRTMILFRPSADFRTLHNVEYFKVTAQDKTKAKKKLEEGNGAQPHP